MNIRFSKHLNNSNTILETFLGTRYKYFFPDNKNETSKTSLGNIKKYLLKALIRDTKMTKEFIHHLYRCQ